MPVVLVGWGSFFMGIATWSTIHEGSSLYFPESVVSPSLVVVGVCEGGGKV